MPRLPTLPSLAPLSEIVAYTNHFLDIDRFADYCPNGLQVEGKAEIKTLITGVTASKWLIDQAVERGADAIAVHHGLFWNKADNTLTGILKERAKTLLENDISLLAYHLPLDCHVEMGNNAQLGSLLHLQNIEAIPTVKPLGLIYKGELEEPLSSLELGQLLFSSLQRQPFFAEGDGRPIKHIAWCTGAGQGFMEQIAKQHSIDAFISGEISESTYHLAKETGVAYFQAGHHATERFGIQALGEHISQHFGVDHYFIDQINPV